VPCVRHLASSISTWESCSGVAVEAPEQCWGVSADTIASAAPKAPTGVTLICTNLPPECNEQIMSALFSQ
jgi:hypothetical protein